MSQVKEESVKEPTLAERVAACAEFALVTRDVYNHLYLSFEISRAKRFKELVDEAYELAHPSNSHKPIAATPPTPAPENSKAKPKAKEAKESNEEQEAEGEKPKKKKKKRAAPEHNPDFQCEGMPWYDPPLACVGEGEERFLVRGSMVNKKRVVTCAGCKKRWESDRRQQKRQKTAEEEKE